MKPHDFYRDISTAPSSRAITPDLANTCFPARLAVKQLQRYRQMADYLANLEPVRPPRDLALRIRVQASQVQAGWLADWWTRARLFFKNILEPLAVPATGGVLTALAVFVLVVQNILVGMPMGGVVPNDLPLNLVQPARLESLAPFPMPGDCR